MICAVINAFLFTLALYLYWRKYKHIDSGVLLLGVYSFVAIMGIAEVNAHPKDWNLTLWPFLYLFVLSMLFFRPYFGANVNSTRLKVRNQNILYYFAIFYILLSVYDAYNDLSSVQEAMLSNMADIRNEFYSEGREEVALPVWIARNIVSYLRPFAILILFFFMSELATKKRSIIFIALLLLSIVIPSFFEALTIASRGMIITLFIQLLVGYILFSDSMSKTVKKNITVAGTVLLVLFLTYSIIVTLSRFTVHNEYESGGDSLIFYFGHSMLTFDYGVVDTISRFLDGKALMGTVGKNIDGAAGTHFESHFYTFIGILYIDFGPILTFLLSLIVPLPFMSIKKKRSYDIADLFLFFSGICFLINGVFVVPIGYYLSLIMIVLTYILLKIFK